jgi:hypothetical protein
MVPGGGAVRPKSPPRFAAASAPTLGGGVAAAAAAEVTIRLAQAVAPAVDTSGSGSIRLNRRPTVPHNHGADGSPEGVGEAAGETDQPQLADIETGVGPPAGAETPDTDPSTDPVEDGSALGQVAQLPDAELSAQGAVVLAEVGAEAGGAAKEDEEVRAAEAIEGAPSASSAAGVVALFEQLDTDGDRLLTADELQAAIELSPATQGDTPASIDGGGGGGAGAEEQVRFTAAHARPGEACLGCDRSGPCVVTGADYQHAALHNQARSEAAAMVQQMDTDGDGAVTEAEFQSAQGVKGEDGVEVTAEGMNQLRQVLREQRNARKADASARPSSQPLSVKRRQTSFRDAAKTITRFSDRRNEAMVTAKLAAQVISVSCDCFLINMPHLP